MKTKSGMLFILIAILTLSGFIFETKSFADVDVTGSVQLVKSPLGYNRLNKTSYLDVSVKNTGQVNLLASLTVVIDSINNAAVTVANADGVTSEGKPYFTYTLSNALAQGQTTASKRWVFSNPSAARFTYTVRAYVASLSDGTAVVGPEGGVVEVMNPSNPLYGFRLEVPPGALSQPVTITANSAPCDSIDPILAARQLASHEKKCLTAFSANPDGLIFNTPATVRLPVQPLIPGWTPLQIGFDLDQQTYWIVPGEIVYLGQENVVEMKIDHFSGIAAVQAQSNTVLTEAICNTCQGYKDNSEHCILYKDPFEDLCCLILIVNRAGCDAIPAGGCHCCKQEKQVVTVKEADFSSGDCQLVGSVIDVQFPMCPPEASGPPDALHEQTPPCNDMILTVDIFSPKSLIRPCEEVTMMAEVSGSRPDGTVLFKAAPFPADWGVQSGEEHAKCVQDVGTNGQVIKGQEPGPAVIKASAVGPRDVENRYFGVFNLTVEEPVHTLTSTSSDPLLDVGQKLELSWSCPDCVPASPPGKVQWFEIDTDSAVEISELPGDILEVTARKCGKAVIQASYQHCGMQNPIAEMVLVTVKGIPKDVTVTPGTVTLGINESKKLTARITDEAGNECPDFRIDKWENADPFDMGIATVDSAGNVTGHSEGQALILAWSGSEYGMALVKVLPAKVVVMPSTVALCVGKTRQLTATVTDAVGNPYTGCDVHWFSGNVDVVGLPPGAQGPQVSVWGVSEGGASVSAVCGTIGIGSASVTVKEELAKIDINPPYNASMKVFTSVVGMTGTIITECGQGRVNGLVVTVEDATGESQVYPPVLVGSNGSFSVTVTLHWGVNRLTFATYDGTRIVPNDMEGIDFTLDRVPHCLKDGSTLSLPAATATGMPLFWISEDSQVASVDSSGHVVTANSDGWAWIYADVGTLRVVRLVGVSSMSDWVPVYPGDPFYSDPPPPPAILGQMGLTPVGSDLFHRYWIAVGPQLGCTRCAYENRSHCKMAASLYDTHTGSLEFISNEGLFSNVYPRDVNEFGQVVGNASKDLWCAGYSTYYPVWHSSGFIYDNGSLYIIDYPDAFDTSLGAISNSGLAIGGAQFMAEQCWTDYFGQTSCHLVQTYGTEFQVGIEYGFTPFSLSPYYVAPAGEILCSP